LVPRPQPGEGQRIPAAAGSPTYRKVDLLTMVDHELGHEFGFADTAGDDCPALAGRIGLQAEYFAIEFKGLKFKVLD
jgi:hypothetical protein